MKKKHLAELKWEKEVQRRWKQEQATQEEYRDIAWAYREMLEHLQLKLARDIKKSASMSTLAAKVAIENVDPRLSGAEKLVTKDTEKTKVFNDLFASVFTGKVCLRTSQPAAESVGLMHYLLYR